MQLTPDHIRLIQRALGVNDDGIWGPISQRAYDDWLLESRPPGALIAEDYRRAAERLNVPEAAIRAVVEVESRGSGFLADGRPTILFEAHIFARLTGGRFTAAYPQLSSSRWDRTLYQGGAREWPRLEAAIRLDEAAALQSASWGLFQIMGFNYRACQFLDIGSFVAAHKRCVQDHLDAFVALIESWDIARHLRGRNWAAFARRYNGPSYAANRYDERLAAAYRRHV